MTSLGQEREVEEGWLGGSYTQLGVLMASVAKHRRRTEETLFLTIAESPPSSHGAPWWQRQDLWVGMVTAPSRVSMMVAGGVVGHDPGPGAGIKSLRPPSGSALSNHPGRGGKGGKRAQDESVTAGRHWTIPALASSDRAADCWWHPLPEHQTAVGAFWGDHWGSV